MKLYVMMGSPNSRKVLAVVKQLDIPVDIEYLDFFAGDLGRPEYLAINPNGMVPALEDGDFRLWESNAIMQYLADQQPANRLFPRDARLRADVVRWQCWELAHFNKAFGNLGFETVAKPGFMDMPPDAAVVSVAQRDLARFAPVLDGYLKGRQTLVGDGVTLADYSMVHVEGFKEAVPFDWQPYPHLNAYFERMRADPAWQATAPPSREAIGRRPAKG